MNGYRLDESTDQKLVGRKMSGMPSWVDMGMPLPPLEDNYSCVVQPVILQGKPDLDNKLSVMEWIVQIGLDTIHKCNKEWKVEYGESSQEEETTELLTILAQDFATLLTLSNDQCRSLPSELSPSGEYLFGIACGCMMSISPSISVQSTKSNIDNIAKNGLHYPILLFDELFDTEHPSTVENCSRGILNLIDAGSVVISATHRPGYFHSMSSRTVTFSGGKVLTDERV